jgi:hypothetical protein
VWYYVTFLKDSYKVPAQSDCPQMFFKGSAKRLEQLYSPFTYGLQILWYHVTMKNDAFNEKKWHLQPLKIEIFYIWPQNNIPWKFEPGKLVP